MNCMANIFVIIIVHVCLKMGRAELEWVWLASTQNFARPMQNTLLHIMVASLALPAPPIIIIK